MRPLEGSAAVVEAVGREGVLAVARALAAAGSALARAGETLEGFVEPGFDPRFAACGSTALGVEAATRDLSAREPRIYRGLCDWDAAAGAERRPVIGISMSGRSDEVRDVLARASAAGARTLFVTGGEPMAAATDNLALDLEAVPTRLLPIAACLLAQRCFGSSSAAELQAGLLAGRGPGFGELPGFLASAYSSSLAPVFVSSEGRYAGELLAAAYMESLKRPAFAHSFPPWTHGLLWALGEGDAGRFAFVHLRPQDDLADTRFAKAVERLDSLGIAQLVLEGLMPWFPAFPNCSRLVQVLLMFRALADDLGLDPDRELGF